MKTLSTYDPAFEPQLSAIEVAHNVVSATIGMLSSNNPLALPLLTLSHIEKFVNEHIAVLVQRGLGEIYAIPDYHFTEHGAEIIEDEQTVIAHSNIVLKYDPFSLEEIFFLKEKQIIISTTPSEALTQEMVQFLNEKKITAVGISSLNVAGVLLQDTIKQLVSLFVYSQNKMQMIQINPHLLKSVYCYNGEICNRTVAENAGVPWKDLVELCWNWN